jgi:hypothetical protein
MTGADPQSKSAAETGLFGREHALQDLCFRDRLAGGRILELERREMAEAIRAEALKEETKQ